MGFRDLFKLFGFKEMNPVQLLYPHFSFNMALTYRNDTFATR